MKQPIVTPLIGLLMALVAPLHAVDFYVATEGDDDWTGQLQTLSDDRTDGPFATLERAQLAVRRELSRSKDNGGPITVHVRAGTYELRKTVVLDVVASEHRPVLFRNYHNESVRITGGRQLSRFQRITDPVIRNRLDPTARGQVYQVDLKSQGITD